MDNSVSAMALRTVVVTLPRPIPGVSPTKEVNEAYSAVSRVLIPRLIGRHVVPHKAHIELPVPPKGSLDNGTAIEMSCESVDVLIEVVRCFGPMLHAPEIEKLYEVIVKILETESSSSMIKKRAVVAISILSVYLSDALLSAFVSHLIELFRSPHLTHIKRRMYITVLGSMARSIPARFGPYLRTLAPFVLSALSEQELSDQLESAEENGEPDLELDDVRESALVALEGFMAYCGHEMRPYTEETIAAALRFLKYDPNYTDDEDDEEMSGTQSDDENVMSDFGDDDEFEEADFDDDDDDDDASWKVRRCAAKVLYTLISTRGSGDLLDDGTLYQQVAPSLIKRFSEREENVRLEVISTLSCLVRKTADGTLMVASMDSGADYMSLAPQGRKRRRTSSSVVMHGTSIAGSAGLTSPTIEPLPESGPRADLARISPAIIKAGTKLLGGKSIPTKQAVVILLSNMISVQHGGLAGYFSQIVNPIVEAIKSAGVSGGTSGSSSGGVASATGSTLSIAALRLLSDISETHSSSVLKPYLAKIVPGVLSAVNAKYHKVSAEAINTVEQVVKALTPPRSQSMGEKHQSELQKLYEAIVGRVSANDADSEVRQRAIHALGILLARTASTEGSRLLSSQQRLVALDLLKERLKNETTRLAAVRAVETISMMATTKDQLQPEWTRDVSLELAAQLRKSNRSLRGASLSALKSLITTPAARSHLDHTTISGLVNSLLPLVTVGDLHMLGPALLVVAALVEYEPDLVVTDRLDSALCTLLTAPIIGAVLEQILTLVKCIGEKGVGKPLMNGLLKEVSINGDPMIVGKVTGTLLVSGGSSSGVTIDSFRAELDNASSDGPRKSLALAVLGETALRMGISSSLQPDVFTRHFTSKLDKVPLAAAIALGRAGAGNIQVYLPVILQAVDEGGSTQYLLLHSIKEILQHGGSGSSNITPYTKSIWEKLLVASQAEDNKAVGAECIGRLAIIDPKTYLPQLQVGVSLFSRV